MYYKAPFFLALKAIALPMFVALLEISPLKDKSKTLKLLHSPKEIQNWSTKLGFKLKTLLANTT